MIREATVLLVDDHPMLRKGLHALIEQEKGFTVIGEAGDGLEGLEQARQLKPDIVVMDINMPNLNGIDATRQIRDESPETKILALSIHAGKHFVEDMLEAGASGYLLKECAPEELIQALTALKQGKGYLSADITQIVLDCVRKNNGEGQRLFGRRMNGKPIASRLERPGLSTGYNPPAQLITKLESGHNKTLTLVAAPAGSGKTSLVSAWLEQCEMPSAWLSLDKNDNDLHQFLSSLCAAIHILHPEACPQSQALLETANLPPVSTLAKILIDDLGQIPDRFILVLDSYHQIVNKGVHDLLSALLKRPLFSLHLVLITCRDPFVPLSTLLANNELNEIRRQDLIPEAEPTGSWRAHLTNREYEILLLIEERLRDKEIAEKLCISTETVKSHLKNLFSKLDASDRRDAIVKAVQLGFIKES